MRRLFLAAAIALTASPALALFDTTAPGFIVNGPYKSAGAAQMGLSVGASAVSLTVPSGASIAEICAEGGVRYRDDGTAPTATVGMPVPSGTCFAYSGPLSAIQFISESGTVSIDVSYYR